jgi:hypothetical protein
MSGTSTWWQGELAAAFRLPTAAVVQIEKRIAPFGILPRGGRGRYAPRLEAKHIAGFIAALLAAADGYGPAWVQVGRTVNELQNLTSKFPLTSNSTDLQRLGSFRIHSDFDPGGDDHASRLAQRDVPPRNLGFIDALSWLIENMADPVLAEEMAFVQSVSTNIIGEEVIGQITLNDERATVVRIYAARDYGIDNKGLLAIPAGQVRNSTLPRSVLIRIAEAYRSTKGQDELPLLGPQARRVEWNDIEVSEENATSETETPNQGANPDSAFRGSVDAKDGANRLDAAQFSKPHHTRVGVGLSTATESHPTDPSKNADTTSRPVQADRSTTREPTWPPSRSQRSRSASTPITASV